MNCNYSKPINIGNPSEFTIIELAKLIKAKINSNSELKFLPLPQDDPMQRKPLIELAKKELDWEPSFELKRGLDITIDYFKKEISG